MALSTIPCILNIGRNVRNPLLDGFGIPFVHSVAFGWRFDGSSHAPMLAELLRVLNHGILLADASRWTFEVDGRRSRCTIVEGATCTTEFPTTKLDIGLTESQIVLMAVLSSEVGFYIYGEVTYRSICSHEFKEKSGGRSIHLELVSHIRLRRYRNGRGHEVKVVGDAAHIGRHRTFYISTDT